MFIKYVWIDKHWLRTPTKYDLKEEIKNMCFVIRDVSNGAKASCKNKQTKN